MFSEPPPLFHVPGSNDHILLSHAKSGRLGGPAQHHP
jgi:hypothetical protein